MLFIPFLISTILFVLLEKMKIIYSLLVNIVSSPYEINFTQFERVRQPMINIDKIKPPGFLENMNTNYKTLKMNELYKKFL